MALYKCAGYYYHYYEQHLGKIDSVLQKKSNIVGGYVLAVECGRAGC